MIRAILTFVILGLLFTACDDGEEVGNPLYIKKVNFRNPISEGDSFVFEIDAEMPNGGWTFSHLDKRIFVYKIEITGIGTWTSGNYADVTIPITVRDSIRGLSGGSYELKFNSRDRVILDTLLVK